MLTRQKLCTGIILLVALMTTQPTWAKKAEVKVHPDYTKGEKLANTDNFWNIGPTGIVGYFWSRRTTTQIPVKEVQAGSPAEGLIKEGDVLVGLGDTRFTNARDELIDAIIEAEKQKKGGKITFNVWRPSEEKYQKVTLTVPFMGAYSETSPWNCPKTDAIIEKAVQHIIDSGLGEEQMRGQERHPITEDLNALGLLATGDKKHLPLIRAYAHKVAGPDIIYKRGVKTASAWGGGYRNIFLTEYYLITKDEHVLPTIKSLSEYIALGVSGVGTWSHGMAAETYGPPGAYGAMNHCSITCSLSLVLARKCGIESPAINKAIELNISFLDWFIDKGTIPYGDHAANVKSHDSNGRNSHAAVLYDLYGKKKGAEYFTRMTLASYVWRDAGHSGHYWSGIWGPLGAARGGKVAAGAFIQNTKYYTELERRFDGSFIHQGADKNTGWDCTGARLIAYCLPRKALYISGKGDSVVEPIVGDKLKSSLAAGPFTVGDISVGTFAPPTLTTDELVNALGSWSPVVREQAAQELDIRKENVVDKLLAMLESPDANKRYGACLGLSFAGRGSEKAVQALLAKLQDSKDMTMRYYAVSGLKYRIQPGRKSSRGKNLLGDAVLVAGPALVKLAGEFDKEQDPYGKLNQLIVNTLFYKGRVEPIKGYYMNGKGLEKLDSDHVVAAMKAWLSNPNGGARTGAVNAYRVLSKEQIEQLWPYIYNTANEPALSGVMFAGGGKKASMNLLAHHRFEEALPMAISDLVQDGWGTFSRVPAAINLLAVYGSAAKPYMAFVDYQYKEFCYRGPKEAASITESYNRLKENLDKDMEVRSIKPIMQAAGFPYKKPDVSKILKHQARMYYGWEVVGLPPEALAKGGKTPPENRTWRYMTLSPKPDKTYETLNVFMGNEFKDVATGEGLADWFKPNFDDTSWKRGYAPIGKGTWRDEQFEITARTQWDNDDTYLLMRTTIEADPERYEKYRFQLVDTIGVRIYFNGQEVFTPQRYWSRQPKYRDVNDKISGIIKKGTNVLAIYACNHQRGPVMVDCYIQGLLKEENFDPTPYYKEEADQ